MDGMKSFSKGKTQSFQLEENTKSKRKVWKSALNCMHKFF